MSEWNVLFGCVGEKNLHGILLITATKLIGLWE